MTATTQYDSLDELVDEMAAHWAENKANYQNEDWCEIVHEDENVVVLADHKGYELTEWGNDFGDYYAVSEHMHKRARGLCDYVWSASWPVVYEK